MSYWFMEGFNGFEQYTRNNVHREIYLGGVRVGGYECGTQDSHTLIPSSPHQLLRNYIIISQIHAHSRNENFPVRALVNESKDDENEKGFSILFFEKFSEKIESFQRISTRKSFQTPSPRPKTVPTPLNQSDSIYSRTKTTTVYSDSSSTAGNERGSILNFCTR